MHLVLEKFCVSHMFKWFLVCFMRTEKSLENDTKQRAYTEHAQKQRT